MDSFPLVWDCAGRNEVFCPPPIGAYRDEFALIKTDNPEHGNCMEHPYGIDRSNGSSGALGATSKGNLREKKGLHSSTRARHVACGSEDCRILSRAESMYLYAQVTGHIGTLPICETLADSLPSRQTGNDDRDSTWPGVILLLGFEQSPILVSTMEFVPQSVD